MQKPRGGRSQSRTPEPAEALASGHTRTRGLSAQPGSEECPSPHLTCLSPTPTQPQALGSGAFYSHLQRLKWRQERSGVFHHRALLPTVWGMNKMV